MRAEALGSGGEGEEFLQELYRGGELLAAGDVAQAAQHLERAHQLEPRNEKGQNLLGLAYFKLGNFERAAEIYELLVKDNPADPTLRVNLGLVYLKANVVQRAIREFEAATLLAPEHTKAQNYLGLALAQAQDYARARMHFAHAGSDAMVEKMDRALAGESAEQAAREPVPSVQLPQAEAGGWDAAPTPVAAHVDGVLGGVMDSWGEQVAPAAEQLQGSAEAVGPVDPDLSWGDVAAGTAGAGGETSWGQPGASGSVGALAEALGAHAAVLSGEPLPAVALDDAFQAEVEILEEAPAFSGGTDWGELAAVSMEPVVELPRGSDGELAVEEVAAGAPVESETSWGAGAASWGEAPKVDPLVEEPLPTSEPDLEIRFAEDEGQSSSMLARFSGGGQGTPDVAPAEPEETDPAGTLSVRPTERVASPSGAVQDSSGPVEGPEQGPMLAVDALEAMPELSPDAVEMATEPPAEVALNVTAASVAEERGGGRLDEVPVASVLEVPASGRPGWGGVFSSMEIPDRGDETFQIAEQMLVIRVERELLTRTVGLVAWQGALEWEPERRRQRGRRTEVPFGEGVGQIYRARGKGRLVLDSAGRKFWTLELGDGSAYFREGVVFAFEEAVMFENGRLPGSGETGSVELVHLMGGGQVLLALTGAPRTLAVRANAPVTVPAERLVGWTGSVSPRLLAGMGPQAGAVELSGEGIAIFVAGLG